MEKLTFFFKHFEELLNARSTGVGTQAPITGGNGAIISQLRNIVVIMKYTFQ